MSRLLTVQEAKHFREILDNYQLNQDALKQFRQSNFVIVTGPAGAGKDTLRNALVYRFPDKYLNILSTTTRPPREGEKDGKDYHFREISEVEKNLRKREFFQATIVHNQQISCLHMNEIRKLQPTQFGVSILIPLTEEKLRITKPDIKTIFLIPPNLKILKARIKSEKVINQAEIRRRLRSAAQEINYALKTDYYYCIVSDTVEHVVARAHNFLQKNERHTAEDFSARTVMKQIVLELS